MKDSFLFLGISSDLLVILLVFIIASRYHWFRHVLLQMDESFTRWFRESRKLIYSPVDKRKEGGKTSLFLLLT
jgi:hypothetical protein